MKKLIRYIVDDIREGISNREIKRAFVIMLFKEKPYVPYIEVELRIRNKKRRSARKAKE